MRTKLLASLQRRGMTGEGPMDFKHKRPARRRQAQNIAREAKKARI